MVYWVMSPTRRGATLVNRCREDQTFEARLTAGTLSGASRGSRSAKDRVRKMDNSVYR